MMIAKRACHERAFPVKVAETPSDSPGSRAAGEDTGSTESQSASGGREADTVRLDPSGAGPAARRAASAITPGLGPRMAAKYGLISEIGRGGMSVVYLARDEKLGRFIALKRMGDEFLSNSRIKERFFREAKSIAALNHVHIVHVYDLEEDDRGPVIVMEYVAGPLKPPSPNLPPPSLNLEQKVDQVDGLMVPRAALDLIRKLCRAMDYAHGRGVIHRDLKPSNILFDESGEPKIVDFGLARRSHGEDPKLTLPGAKILSLGYGAPEQEEDTSTADGRADIYGLGGVLYFCLTGENPRFFRESKIPAHLRPALLRALEKDPAMRWQTAREFEEALSQSEGLYVSSKTDIGMWRCKWCNALSALESRYCSECGWDGLETCPECRGETRVGVRFCGSCGTDIKAFEDVQGLLDRLRVARHQKDFERVLRDEEGVSRFQPRGDVGRGLMREVQELQETAKWALARKDELRQAISAELEKERYEEVRDRLSEYDVLDSADLYRDLRVQLPEKVAERDIRTLEQGVARARALMAQRHPVACRTVVEEIKAQRMRVQGLEDQFPGLKAKLAAGESANGSANPLAARIETANAAIAGIEAEVAEAERRIPVLMREAEEALVAQDYELCLKKGEEIRQLSAESGPVDEVMGKASAKSLQVFNNLKRAEQALAYGKFDAAERICMGVIERLKHDSVEAGQMLRRIVRRRRRKNAVTAALVVICYLVAYVLSMCPVDRLVEKGYLPANKAAFTAIYRPVFWLHRHTALAKPLDLYAAEWGSDVFRTR